MFKKLVNTSVEHIVRGDKSEEYRVKYIYTLFGITITKYDPIVFYNLNDAAILASIGVSPSKIVRNESCWDGGNHILGLKFCSDENCNIYRVFTKYDKMLRQCSASDINIYRRVINGNKLLWLKPKYIYILTEYAGSNTNRLSWYLAGNKYSQNIIDAIYVYNAINGKPVVKNTQFCVESFSAYIEKFIDARLEYFKQEVRRIDDEAYKARQKIENEISIKRQHETIASVREVFTNNIHTESFEHYTEQFINNIENDKLKEQRNKVIKDELKRIDKYKAHLISLMH